MVREILTKERFLKEKIIFPDDAFFPQEIENNNSQDSLFLVDDKVVKACCSIWTDNTPDYMLYKTGCIGDLFANDINSGLEILKYAEDQLKKHKINYAIGPMNGNTWNKYRLVSESTDHKPFFLEYFTPLFWKNIFINSRYSSIASFSSAITDNLSYEYKSDESFEKFFKELNLKIRNFNINNPICDLKKIYKLSIICFAKNFLYSYISEKSFLDMYEKIIPYIDPELFLLIEHNNNLIAFVFAIPDYNQTESTDTLIIKTMARDPNKIYAGLGNLMAQKIHLRAREKNYKQVIHALMHDSNSSKIISNKSAKKIRTYELFGKELL